MSTESGLDRVRRERGFGKNRHYYVTGNDDRRPQAWHEENWPEYLNAQFQLLRDIEPELARALAERLVRDCRWCGTRPEVQERRI